MKETNKICIYTKTVNDEEKERKDKKRKTKHKKKGIRVWRR